MKKRYQTSETLPVGLLLALAGGFLDAYSYLNRGQVFATAETGNLVLLGINFSMGNWSQALHYLLPVLAYTAGVLVTELLRRRLGEEGGWLHWRQYLLLMECVVIGAVAFLPPLPGSPGQHYDLLCQRGTGRLLPEIQRLRLCHYHVYRQPEKRYGTPVFLAVSPGA